jgi:hypothetical protein
MTAADGFAALDVQLLTTRSDLFTNCGAPITELVRTLDLRRAGIVAFRAAKATSE